VSIHKLRRQLTAANKKVKWYEAYFEAFPASRRRRSAYVRRIFERGEIRFQLALARANVHPFDERAYLDGLSQSAPERRGYYLPFNAR
jgi:hypothetical protein